MLSKTQIQEAEAQSLANENGLQLYIRRQGLDEVRALNALTEAGLIADEAIMARDVAPCDCFAACLFLQNNLDALK